MFTHFSSPVSMLGDTIKPAYQWLKAPEYRLNGPYDVEHGGEDFLDKGRNPKARSSFWLPTAEGWHFKWIASALPFTLSAS